MYKMVNSIRTDDLDTFKLVWEHFGFVHEKAIFECCYHGSLKILEFLMSLNMYPCENDVYTAIHFSRHNLLYLFAEEVPDMLNATCTELAYDCRDYKSLRKLVDIGVECTDYCRNQLIEEERRCISRTNSVLI